MKVIYGCNLQYLPLNAHVDSHTGHKHGKVYAKFLCTMKLRMRRVWSRANPNPVIKDLASFLLMLVITPTPPRR